MILPDTTRIDPNSPSDRAMVKINPYTTPQRILGQVTWKKVRHGPAPKVAEASSDCVPISSSKGTTSLTISGNVINMVAITIPGMAYTIFILWSSRNAPSAVFGPKIKITINPTMTGDTAKG